MRKIIIVALFLSGIVKSTGQNFDLNVFSGISVNHSQRSLYSTNYLNDNFYSDHFYGLNSGYWFGVTGINLGVYSTTFANVMNFRGDPRFLLSKQHFYWKYQVLGINLGLKHKVLGTKKFLWQISYGVDINLQLKSYLEPLFIQFDDSLIYNTNRFHLSLEMERMRPLYFMPGVFFNTSFNYEILKNLYFNLNLYYRMGLTQTMHTFFYYEIKNDVFSSDAGFISNKNDFIGLSFGFQYKFGCEKIKME